MKRTTFGGILIWPAHPFADMHGLLRACCSTKSLDYVNRQAQRYGARLAAGTWTASRSAVEQAITERDYGMLLVAPVWASYLSADFYQRARDFERQAKMEPPPEIFHKTVRDPRL